MKLSPYLRKHSEAFGIFLSEEDIARLELFYSVIQEHNEVLHLVGPMSDEEFAVRHVLESLTMLDELNAGTHFADVGSGGGLPALPCVIVRPDLRCSLIEAKQKKARFLSEAAERIGVEQRVDVVNRQFHETSPGNATVVTCRALDKFTDKLPKLVEWSGRRTMLLFGGPTLARALERLKPKHTSKLMPGSQQRYLYVVPARKHA
jgi:16S rRNA (guanine(527)-N(7))-methyltransferase RsmG